jgi:hypothetical protein
LKPARAKLTNRQAPEDYFPQIFADKRESERKKSKGSKHFVAFPQVLDALPA